MTNMQVIMNTIDIPQGCLAEDADLATKRAELKRQLLEGEEVHLLKTGEKDIYERSSIQLPIDIWDYDVEDYNEQLYNFNKQ